MNSCKGTGWSEAASADTGEMVVAVQFLLRKSHFRFGRDHGGLRLSNQHRLPRWLTKVCSKML